jgi:hypothetical protein
MKRPRLFGNQGLPRPGAKGVVVTLAGRTEPIPFGREGSASDSVLR